ncbi:NUDIX domain-containing protein [Candidatus Pacearchaeota archaeon]|nr:NUDIX domain-containing protein [Candidatus Pacearchaeota archaeon]
MKYDKNQAHYVVITCIPVNEEGKYLIAKRAEKEKAFPGLWTVPGGKLEVLDYALREKDTSAHWYNVFEDVAKKEMKEEVGLEVKNIEYVTSMVYIRSDGVPAVIVSLWAKVVGDSTKVKLCHALTDYKWVTLEEAKNYELIDGIYEELEILDRKLKDGGKMGEWKKSDGDEGLFGSY